ncbi:MAG: hypothetical protein HYU74_11480 [Dechloromonas sp.]|nr:hypothetical protein [Dechloromonas sp.]
MRPVIDRCRGPVDQALHDAGITPREIDRIGGVNEKIEGFFDICRALGLSGEQGVLIPAANVKHLMLRAVVVAACSAGNFHIYAMNTVDQAIELLTGVPAGAADAQGELPAGSINRLVADKPAHFSALRKAFGASGQGSPQADAGSKGTER